MRTSLVAFVAVVVCAAAVDPFSARPAVAFLQQEDQSAIVYVVQDVADGPRQTFTYKTADMSRGVDPLEAYVILQDEQAGVLEVLEYTDRSGFVQSVTP